MSKAITRAMRVLMVMTVMALVVPAGSGAQLIGPGIQAAKKDWGYITMPDGAQLKYSVWLPEGKGPFPVLMQYEGYNAGSDPSRANAALVPELLKRGYAILGVSVRGSACSDGTWQLFSKQQGDDGAAAVEWAARQPWANGKVALFSYSYGGIMQLWVAASRPPHLVAIGPGNPVTDTYRDIGYPGGMLNAIFPPEWGASLNVDWTIAEDFALRDGDQKCLANYAAHAVNNNLNTLLLQMIQHPYDDRWHQDHSIINVAKNIDVPVLATQSWQDEETGSRSSLYLDQLDPAKTWLISTNGHHSMFATSKRLINRVADYYDYVVKGIKNDYATGPHVQIWDETTANAPEPRSITTRDRLPVRVDETDVPLGPEGLQSNTAAATSFPYPVPSPPLVDATAVEPAQEPQLNTWGIVPHLGLGRAIFTTPPLSRTITTFGPSSADLWVSTTADDTDLQVTMTEVRPDGKEMYVERGWLRASHRALDAKKSTALRPWHPHTKASIEKMTPGKPQLLRVEVFPYSHTFRAGSSVRMYVELPSVTGLWGFAPVATPQTVTVHHDAAHPSRLVLGLLPDANVKNTLPDCSNVHSEPCRANPVPQPKGSLDIEPTRRDGATARGPVELRFYGRRDRDRRSVLVKLRSTGARLAKVTLELRRGTRTVARSEPMTVGSSLRSVVLRRSGTRRYASGNYTLVVKRASKVLMRRTVRVGKG